MSSVLSSKVKPVCNDIQKSVRTLTQTAQQRDGSLRMVALKTTRVAYHPISDFSLRHVRQPPLDHVDEVSGIGPGRETVDEVEVEWEMGSHTASLVTVV